MIRNANKIVAYFVAHAVVGACKPRERERAPTTVQRWCWGTVPWPMLRTERMALECRILSKLTLGAVRDDEPCQDHLYSILLLLLLLYLTVTFLRHGSRALKVALSMLDTVLDCANSVMLMVLLPVVMIIIVFILKNHAQTSGFDGDRVVESVMQNLEQGSDYVRTEGLGILGGILGGANGTLPTVAGAGSMASDLMLGAVSRGATLGDDAWRLLWYILGALGGE